MTSCRECLSGDKDLAVRKILHYKTLLKNDPGRRREKSKTFDQTFFNQPKNINDKLLLITTTFKIIFPPHLHSTD